METAPGPNPNASHRFLLIDAARGLICLWVVVDHCGFSLHDVEIDLPGIEGAVRRALVAPLRWALGPSLFFLISGYCIAASADSTRRRGGSALEFLARRAWRTFPPYWAALLGFVALIAGLEAVGLGRAVRHPYGLELGSPADLTGPQWLGNLTLTEGWRPLVGGGQANVLTRVAWSLCYQEQFYFVCFLALACARRRFHRALLAATGLILAYRVFAWDSGRLHRIDGSFAMLWHEFAAGLAVYWRLHLATTARQRRALEAALALLLALGLAQGMSATAAAAGAGLALIAARRWDGRLSALPGAGGLRALGRRSYSIYLVHLPPCIVGCGALVELGLTGFWARMLVVLPLTTAAAVAVGWAFHAAVERRFLEPPALPARSPRTARAGALVGA